MCNIEGSFTSDDDVIVMIRVWGARGSRKNKCVLVLVLAHIPMLSNRQARTTECE